MNRTVKILSVAAAALIVGTGTGAALTFIHTAGQITSQDSIELSTSPAIENGLTVAEAFPGIGAGTQVTILDPSRKVIATAALTQGATSMGSLLNGEFLNFTVTVPSGLSLYGIEVPGLTVMWASEKQMRAGVTVNAEK
jgi:hypothetical protein